MDTQNSLDASPDLPNPLLWLETVLASSPDGYLLVDSAGIVLRANAALAQIFGVPPAQVEGQPEAAALAVLEQAAVVLDQYPLAGAPPDDGTVRYLALAEPQPQVVRHLTRPLGGAGHLHLFQDRTAESQLEGMHEVFGAFTNHYLKTPVMSIQNTLLMVLRGLVGPLDLNDEQHELLNMILNSSRGMYAALQWLTDIARLEGGTKTLERAPTHLQTVIDMVLESVRYEAESRSITLQISVAPSLPRINIDQGLLARAISYLLEYVIKFTPSRGTVTMAAQHGEDGPASSMVFWIEDSGPEIPKQYWPHVFAKFSRVPGYPAGFGLGFAFAKLVVDAHGGKIWVERARDGGNRFCLTLPLA